MPNYQIPDTAETRILPEVVDGANVLKMLLFDANRV